MIPRVKDFEDEIMRLIKEAEESGETFIDINSGILHKMMGDYRGKDARFPSCCSAMRKFERLYKTETLEKPEKGDGSRLTIRYYL